MDIREAYAKKLSISEKVYAKEHGSRSMPESKKIAVARVLANTSAYITEAYSNSEGTQLSAMKTNKKFCMDLTTVALPSLIANELVIVYPMKSRTGFIQYLEFIASTNKGGVEKGDLFNNPFQLGQMTDARMNYTAAVTTETFDAEAATYMEVTPVWNPVASVDHVFVDNTEYTIVKTAAEVAAGKVFVEISPSDRKTVGLTFASALATTNKVKLGYKYDNVVIPQNDIPTVGARINEKSLTAKARRVQIYYSQMAAFQAKTEMGIDLGEVLASQACGELSYQTDTEIVKMLVDGAGAVQEKLKWNTRCPVGVNMRDHFASFANVIERGSQIIYDRTQRHAANYMIASSSLKPILALMDGWKAASAHKINGPHYAGEINGVKVFISPAMNPGEFVLGYNGGDFTTSAGVYAPYMMIVPTQLLGYADGSMNQGFSTLYDAIILNDLLLVKGKVEDDDVPNYVVGTQAYTA